LYPVICGGIASIFGYWWTWSRTGMSGDSFNRMRPIDPRPYSFIFGESATEAAVARFEELKAISDRRAASSPPPPFSPPPQTPRNSKWD
jgi:hypothetical protein